MVPKKSKSQVKQPAKKRVVNKADPKKGLAGAGDRQSLTEILRQAGVSSIRSTTTHPPPDPLRVAIEKFSLSLVSEGMLAMVAMHAYIGGGYSAESVAKLSVDTARAVMAELKNQKDSAK